MKNKERIRILEQEVERLKVQYATLLAEVNRIQFVRPSAPDYSPPPPPFVWPGRGYEIWCQTQTSSDTTADAALSDE